VWGSATLAIPARRATRRTTRAAPWRSSRRPATVVNVSTGDFKAGKAGDSTINARVSLPRPCIAPIVFVTGPAGTDVWFAATGG